MIIIQKYFQNILKNNMKFQVDENGYYGQFGGAFIPELLYPNVKELEDNYLKIMESEEFQRRIQVFIKRLCWPTNAFVFSKAII